MPSQQQPKPALLRRIPAACLLASEARRNLFMQLSALLGAVLQCYRSEGRLPMKCAARTGADARLACGAPCGASAERLRNKTDKRKRR